MSPALHLHCQLVQANSTRAAETMHFPGNRASSLGLTNLFSTQQLVGGGHYTQSKSQFQKHLTGSCTAHFLLHQASLSPHLPLGLPLRQGSFQFPLSIPFIHNQVLLPSVTSFSRTLLSPISIRLQADTNFH